MVPRPRWSLGGGPRPAALGGPQSAAPLGGAAAALPCAAEAPLSLHGGPHGEPKGRAVAAGLGPADHHGVPAAGDAR